MKKGYWVVRAHITDSDEYAKYVSLAVDIVLKYKGRFLVRGGDQDEVEGSGYERTVMVEFLSHQDAKDCYHSAEYQKALIHTLNSSSRYFSIVEGAS